MILVFTIHSFTRSVARYALFGCAVLWILIEALTVLMATFKLPYSIDTFIVALADTPGVTGMIARLVREGWPTIILVFLTMTWQELRRWAKNWFKTTKGHERADLLIVSWFVFLGTLSMVDCLSDVTLVLPMGARETSVVLAYFMGAHWCSRIAHWCTRHCQRRRATRRHVPRNEVKGTPTPNRQAGTRRNRHHESVTAVHATHTA